MSPAVKWSIVGVSFLVMFIGARMVVSGMIDEAPGGSPMPRSGRPPPREPVQAEPMAAPDLAVLDLSAEATPEAWAAAHDALDTWAWLAEGEVSTSLRNDLPALQARATERGQGALAAHILWARVKLAERAEQPDAELAASLDQWKGTEPAAFTWLAPETEQGGPDCGADCG